jgi:hypothetical protein
MPVIAALTDADGGADPRRRPAGGAVARASEALVA